MGVSITRHWRRGVPLDSHDLTVVIEVGKAISGHGKKRVQACVLFSIFWARGFARCMYEKLKITRNSNKNEGKIVLSKKKKLYPWKSTTILKMVVPIG